MASRIDRRLPFPPADLLATVMATRATGLGRLHGLTVDGRRWLSFAATPGPVLPAQRRIDLFPFPALPPAPEVNVYVRPGGKIVGHHAPGDATTQDIQAAVKDAPQVVLTLRSAMLTLREELRDDGPLLIGQIRRIPFRTHVNGSRRDDRASLINTVLGSRVPNYP